MFASIRIILLFSLLFASTASSWAVDLIAKQPAGERAAGEGFMIDIEHGEPVPVIDGIGWLFGVPKKLLLWDSRADNHAISAETVEETADFLAENEVDGVKVRVNQYDPFGEWKRLIDNERVGLGWRATIGSVYTLGYSVLPGRLFGNDWYNPYTDSVHVYSDIPSLAMEQAAHAKDVHDRTHPGFYSAMQLVPFVGIVHEARSKQSVFDHVDEFGTLEERAEARRILLPQLGSEIGGQASLFVPQGDAIFQLTGAAIGHAVGRYEANQIEQMPTPERPVSFSSPTEGTGVDESVLNDVSNAIFSTPEGSQGSTPYDTLFEPPVPEARKPFFESDVTELPSLDSDFTNSGFVDYSLPSPSTISTPTD